MAITDLLDRLTPNVATGVGDSESQVQMKIRAAACKKGMRLWRNNVGAARTPNGGFIRYGLANESQAMNSKIKSSDLIGIRPVTITQLDVGDTIGQFVALRLKSRDGSIEEQKEKKRNLIL